jgi:hypothetical protein
MSGTGLDKAPPNGRLGEVLPWSERAADAGDTRALLATKDLARAGRSAEAENLRRYGREPDTLIAAPGNAE